MLLPQTTSLLFCFSGQLARSQSLNICPVLLFPVATLWAKSRTLVVLVAVHGFFFLPQCLNFLLWTTVGFWVTGGASPTGMNQAVCFGATIVILLCEDTMMLGRGLCLCLFITQSSKTPGKLKWKIMEIIKIKNFLLEKSSLGFLLLIYSLWLSHHASLSHSFPIHPLLLQHPPP